MTDLSEKHCESCNADTPTLDAAAIEPRMAQLSDSWAVADDARLEGTFKFKNYYRTQAFVNAVAFIAHREDHHPDITFGYNQATVSYTTHAIGGLSDNDFISAARIDALLE